MPKRQMDWLPVRIYQSEHQFALATPIAGLEPGDITITIEGKRVTIQGKQRGPHQDDLDLLKAEWSIGPYQREIVLPQNVNGPLTNATYGNGVLVITVPKLKMGEKATRVEFGLETINATRGERVGHIAHDIRPTTSASNSLRRRIA
jgi:Molecular chaperone (small heat shock protein)